MDEVIKREEASTIAKELSDCQRHLKKGNIFSCLVCFEGVLKKMLSTKMLPGDSKQLNRDINIFQHDLADSKTFRDVYGPVTFREDDIPTALDFMKQLIEIKDEETRALLAEAPAGDLMEKGTVVSQVQQIKVLIEKGDYADAQEMIAGDEEIISLLVDEYNSTGIALRQSGHYDEAITAFRKAVVVLPNDEGLYYNIARAYVGKKTWQEAAETIGSSLNINANFTEGIKLLKYIRENGGLDG
jgi:tetratricopeptide (TPR) repeat protein